MRISDWSSDVCSSDLGTSQKRPPGYRAFWWEADCQRKTDTESLRPKPQRTGSCAPGLREHRHHKLRGLRRPDFLGVAGVPPGRSEEHTSELQSLMRISYAVFCLKKKNTKKTLKNN